MTTELDHETSAREVAPRQPFVELMDDDMVRVFSAMSGAERLAIAFAMAESARAMLVAHLRSQHPSWDEEEIDREAARRLSHGAT